MRRPLHLALVVVGLAAVVYGTASLTGGWMTNPPWWETSRRVNFDSRPTGQSGERGAFGFYTALDPIPGRAWISGGVVAVGLGLVAVGALARRQFVPPTE